MKLTTEPGALAAAVKFAARALTARAAYPILGGLKITAGMTAAWRWPRSTTRPRPGPASAPTWASPAPCWRPGRLLADIAAQLPRQPVELASDGAGPDPDGGRTRYTLRLLPADDYPALPELPAPAGHADAGEFAAAVRQVVVAASRDDTLPALCAVQVTFTADAITMVATDRYRAALRAPALAAIRRPAAAAGADPRPRPGRGGPGRRRRPGPGARADRAPTAPRPWPGSAAATRPSPPG